MVIAVDAVGGDLFPENPVAGGILALQEKKDLKILFVGPEDLIRDELKNHDYDEDRVLLLDAPEIVTMEDASSTPLKSKTNSSITVGLKAHKSGKAAGFISAGNTGALLAASTLILGRLDGVSRPTIAAIFPTIKGPGLLVDAGANLELKPEMYFQFAKMGTLYAEEIMGLDSPKVGLLNIGEEPEKGCDIHKEAHQILSKLDNFYGNLEGKGVMTGKADIFLTDGFTGNIMLKFGESIPETLKQLIENTAREMKITDDQKKLVFQILSKTMEQFDYQQFGGVPFMGVDGVSLVGHGNSSPLAIKNMILNASQCVEHDLNDKIVSSLNS